MIHVFPKKLGRLDKHFALFHEENTDKSAVNKIDLYLVTFRYVNVLKCTKNSSEKLNFFFFLYLQVRFESGLS